MKQIVSDLAAILFIVIFLWVGYWMAAVVETGAPMPVYIFVIVVCGYICLILGVTTALIIGTIKMVRKNRRDRFSSTVYLDGKGGFYTRKR